MWPAADVFFISGATHHGVSPEPTNRSAVMRPSRRRHIRANPTTSQPTPVPNVATAQAGDPWPYRGDGLSAAIAVLTATIPVSTSSVHARDEALLSVVPDDCVDLVDLFAGVYAVAHILLLELSVATGESLSEPLQRLALAKLVADCDTRASDG